MEGALFLNVVVGKGSVTVELLTSEDKSLLVSRDTFLVLNFGLDRLYSVSCVDIKSHSSTSESLYEDLNTSTESEDKVECAFLLDVVVGKGPVSFELLTGEDKSLLIGRDTFLVLDLCLDAFNVVAEVDIKSHSSTCEGLYENLWHVFLFLLIYYN